MNPDARYKHKEEWKKTVKDKRRSKKPSRTFRNFITNSPSVLNLSCGQLTTPRQVAINLDETDQCLLDHFIQFVLPTIFPIFEHNQLHPARYTLILKAIQSNSAYLHYCLSVAAQHFKSCFNVSDENLDNGIICHRFAAIRALSKAIKEGESYLQILEATLGLTLFQSVVSRYDDGLPDIPWHQHFHAATKLVQKLNLHGIVSQPTGASIQSQFDMSVFSWIDILGAAMKGVPPALAHTYLEKYLTQVNWSLGLCALMGCDDRVMYLISEIACLDSMKRGGIDNLTLCQHVNHLGEQLSFTEMVDEGSKMPFDINRSISSKKLTNTVTTAFRIAARIYLCSLVPGYSPRQPFSIALVEELTAAL